MGDAGGIDVTLKEPDIKDWGIPWSPIDAGFPSEPKPTVSRETGPQGSATFLVAALLW